MKGREQRTHWQEESTAEIWDVNKPFETDSKVAGLNLDSFGLFFIHNNETYCKYMWLEVSFVKIIRN